MSPARLISFARRFRDDARGSMTVEAVIVMPFMMWLFVAGYAYFDLFHYKSVRQKATFAVNDMISRETDPIDATFLANAKKIFDLMAGDATNGQMRVTVVNYDTAAESYSGVWSEVIGAGSMAPLTGEAANQQSEQLPTMTDGEHLILVETESRYNPAPFKVGLSEMTITTRSFMRPRFASQVCFGDC